MIDKTLDIEEFEAEILNDNFYSLLDFLTTAKQLGIDPVDVVVFKDIDTDEFGMEFSGSWYDSITAATEEASASFVINQIDVTEDSDTGVYEIPIEYLHIWFNYLSQWVDDVFGIVIHVTKNKGCVDENGYVYDAYDIEVGADIRGDVSDGEVLEEYDPDGNVMFGYSYMRYHRDL